MKATHEVTSIAGTFKMTIRPQSAVVEVPRSAQSDPGPAYQVNVTNDFASCTCVGYSRRFKCKHIELARLLILKGTIREI